MQLSSRAVELNGFATLRAGGVLRKSALSFSQESDSTEAKLNLQP